MKILYVTSEANPFAASGGLGDVMGALPVSVHEAGVEASVIMPLYDTMKEEYKSKLEKVIDISFNLSWRQSGASIFKAEHQGVTYYFAENSRYFSRGKLYGENDDIERFAMMRAWLLSMIAAWRPDYIGIEGIQFQEEGGG